MTACRVAVLVFALLTGRGFANEFTIDEWDLTSSVLQAAPNSVQDYFTEVTNPFSESHHVESGVSSASASYDFAWDDSGGHFSIESQIAAELVSGGSNRTSTHGRIWITPSVDLAFHANATMDFTLPGHIMKAVMDVEVRGGWERPFNGYRQHDTFSDGIGSGTLSSGGDFVLSAGQTWKLEYDLYVDTYDYGPLPGSVGEIGTSNGSVDFSFTVLPEPSTFGLLAMSGVMFLRRRSRRA